MNYSLNSLTKRQREVAQHLIDNINCPEQMPMIRHYIGEKYCTVLPGYDKITNPVKDKIVEALSLRMVPGYKVFPEMLPGGDAYVFPQHVKLL